MKTSISNQQMGQTFKDKTGISVQDMRKLALGAGLSANPNKQLTASQAKTMSKTLLKKAEEEGFRLKKGFSKTDDARARDIFSTAKQAAQLDLQKDAGTDGTSAVNDLKSSRVSLWDRLRGKGGVNNNVNNNIGVAPMISAQGQQALAPGTSLTQQNINTKQSQPKPQQKSNMNPMNVGNQQNSPESPEKNMQANIGAEPGFGITKNNNNDNEPKVNLAP